MADDLTVKQNLAGLIRRQYADYQAGKISKEDLLASLEEVEGLTKSFTSFGDWTKKHLGIRIDKDTTVASMSIAGGMLGASAGSTIPGFGTVAGGVAGGAAGAGAGRWMVEGLEDVINDRHRSFDEKFLKMTESAAYDAAWALAAGGVGSALKGIGKRGIRSISEVKAVRKQIEKLGKVWDQGAPFGLHHRVSYLKNAPVTKTSRFINTLRALVVSLPQTAARNVQDALLRGGLDDAANVLDVAMAKTYTAVTGKTLPLARQSVGGFWKGMGKGARKTLDEAFEVLNKNPQKKKDLAELFRIKAGDINIEDKLIDKVLIFNNRQEFFMRRARMFANMDEFAKKMGYDGLGDVVAHGDDAVRKVYSSRALRTAVWDALDFTVAAPPQSKALQNVLDLISKKAPALHLAYLFPRFFTNFGRFITDYSPIGFMKCLTKNGKARILAGDTHQLSKAIVGTGLLGGMYQLKKSGDPSDKWYELGVGDHTLDMRFSMFAPYFFVGDLMARVARAREEGVPTAAYLPPKEEILSDIKEYVLNVPTKNETGIRIMDAFTNAMSAILGTENNPDRAYLKLAQEASKLGAAYMQPLKGIQDAYAVFDKEGSLLRDWHDLAYGPIQNRMPVLSTKLPEKHIGTRAATPKRAAPLLQALGVRVIEKKNYLEKELDRLGVTWRQRNIYSFSGGAKYNNLANEIMGKAAEKYLIPALKSKNYTYQRLPNDIAKKRFLKYQMTALKRASNKLAAKKFKEKYGKEKPPRRSTLDRRLIEYYAEQAAIGAITQPADPDEPLKAIRGLAKQDWARAVREFK